MSKQKAPGKHYRVGISLMEMTEMFPDDEAAEKWIAKVRWPDGPRCPRCNSKNVQVGATHPSNPYRCRQCRKFFSVKTGTVMQNSNLGPKVWVWATYLLTTNLKGVSSMKFYRELKITQKTAWHFRLALGPPDQGELERLPRAVLGASRSGRDLRGGKEKNKHAKKKLHERAVDGKAVVGGNEGPGHECRHGEGGGFNRPTDPPGLLGA